MKLQREQAVRKVLLPVLILSILLFIAIWTVVSQQIVRELSGCLRHLGGVTCYNESMTPLGTTPDAFAYDQMTVAARSQSFCHATLTAIPPIARSGIVAVPVVSLRNRPALNLPSSEREVIYCGQSVEFLDTLTNADGTWYQVRTATGLTGWISSTDRLMIAETPAPEGK